MKWTTEAKVGLFTVIGILLFGACVVFLSRAEIFKAPAMHITGDFQSVTGLKTGNQVKYSGVNVGRVTQMEVTAHGVTVTMDIKEGTEIPKDSTFTLANDGILGDKFIQISPGKSTTYLKDGDTITGEGQSEIDKTMAQATQLMESANKTLGSINNIIGDKQTQDSLKEALRTTATIANNTAALTGQLNQMAAGNQENIHAITSNMVQITRDMAGVTDQFNGTMAQFNKDGQAGNDMRAILTNLKQTSDSVNAIAQSMQGIATDPQSAADIKETLHNTAQLTTKLNRLTGGDVTPGQDGKTPFKATVSSEMLYNNQKDHFSPNADVRLFTGNGVYTMGVTDVGDGSHLELTYGKYLANKFMLRGGLMDGDLGVGLDYGLGSPFSLSAAIMDINDRRYRIRSEFRLHDNTYGVIQFIRPYSATDGGNFFGIRQVF